MSAIRFTAAMLFAVGISAAAHARNNGKQQFSEWSVVKIVNHKGEVTFEAIGTKLKVENTNNRKRNQRNYRPPRMKKIEPIKDLNNKLLAEYNKAAKDYNRKASVWSRDKSNAGKVFLEPRPIRPSVQVLRSRIKDGTVAKKVAENTTAVWKKQLELNAAAKAKREEEEAERRENYAKFREAALQRAAEQKAAASQRRSGSQ